MSRTEAKVVIGAVDNLTPQMKSMRESVKGLYSEIVDRESSAGGKIDQVNRRINKSVEDLKKGFQREVSEISKLLKQTERDFEDLQKKINSTYDKKAKSISEYNRSGQKEIEQQRKAELKDLSRYRNESIGSLRGDKSATESKLQELNNIDAEERRKRLLQAQVTGSDRSRGIIGLLFGAGTAAMIGRQVISSFGTIYGAGRTPGITAEEMAIQQRRAASGVATGIGGAIGTGAMGIGGYLMATGAGAPLGAAIAGTGLVVALASKYFEANAEKDANFREYAIKQREEFLESRGAYQGSTSAGLYRGAGRTGETGFVKKNLLPYTTAAQNDEVILKKPPSADAGSDTQISATGQAADPEKISNAMDNFLGSLDRFSDLGINGAEYYQRASRVARGFMSGRNIEQRTYDIAALQKGLNLDERQLLGLGQTSQLFGNYSNGIRKNIGPAGIVNTVLGVGGVGKENLPSAINTFSAIAQKMSEAIENVPVSLSATLMNTFGKGSGSWNINDPRFLSNINQLQQGLSKPQNDYQKAISFMSLSQSAPGASFWELTKMQEGGLATASALPNLLKTYSKIYGKGDMYKMAVKNRFGFTSEKTDEFLDMVKKGVDVEGAYKKVMTGEDRVSEKVAGQAAAYTSQTKKEQATLSNISLAGSEAAVKQANIIWTKTMDNLFKNFEASTAIYSSKVSDGFMRMDKQLTAVIKKYPL